MCLPTIFADLSLTATAFDGSRFTSRISIWRESREGGMLVVRDLGKRIDRCKLHATDQRWRSPTLGAALMRETFAARDRSPLFVANDHGALPK